MTRLRWFVTPLLMLSVVLAVGSTAPPPEAEVPADVEGVLQRFAEAQASIQTLQASFVEHRETSLFKEAVVQHGQFYHSRPQRYLWDYQGSSPKKILLTSEVLLAYYPELNRAEEVNVRRWTKQIRRYLNVGEDLESLRRDYAISLATPEENDLIGTDQLVLEPRIPKLRSRLDDIRIWIDRETGYTRRVAYRSAKNGDRTVFNFHDIQVNLGIDPSRFEIELPKNVRWGTTFSGFSSR